MTEPWRLEVVDEIGSTSDVLIERAIEGGGEQALMALRQLRGRGRHGRRWDAPPGNLALSVLLRPDLVSDEAGRTVLVAGLAMREALQAYVTDGRRLMLKWPNDVLLDGAKLGGILVESALNGQNRVEWLVIGFGANLAKAPVIDRRTACLADCADPLPSAEMVARALLGRLDEWFAIERRSGFEAVRSAWMRVGHRPGTPVVASGREGRFAGLSGTGHLLLDVNGVIETVSAGEVALLDA